MTITNNFKSIKTINNLILKEFNHKNHIKDEESFYNYKKNK